MFSWGSEKKAEPSPSQPPPQIVSPVDGQGTPSSSDQENAVHKPSSARHILHTGWGTNAEGARKNGDDLERHLHEEGVDTKVQTMSSPNPLEIIPLKLGMQTKASRALGEEKIKAVENDELLMTHGHSQGSAQDRAANEYAIQRLTRPPTEAMQQQAVEQIPDGTTDSEIDIMTADEPTVRTIGTDELRERKGAELARQEAERQVGAHNHSVYTGAATGNHPSVPTTLINRVAETTMPRFGIDGEMIPGSEETMKINTDIVPFANAPTHSRPGLDVQEIPGNQGPPRISEHFYSENYAAADAKATKQILDERLQPPTPTPVPSSEPASESTAEPASSGGLWNTVSSYASSFFSGGWGGSSPSTGTAQGSSEPSSSSNDSSSSYESSESSFQWQHDDASAYESDRAWAEDTLASMYAPDSGLSEAEIQQFKDDAGLS